MNHLKKLDKKRLRRWLIAFFIALLLPTALLIQQSYSRLKWETFHQHQLMAVELSERIDNQLIQLVNTEDQRPFSDFSFLQAPANIKASVIQRSPLSEFPVRSDIPGLLGYFQVDVSGQLLTPIVPTTNAGDYGIPGAELEQRVALQNQIQSILVTNKLVQKLPVSPSTSVLQAAAVQEEQAEVSIMAEARELEPDEAARQSSAMKQESAAGGAFDQLKEFSKKSAPKNDYGSVEDLQLQQSYVQQDKFAETKRKSAPRQQRNIERQTKPAASAAIPASESDIDDGKPRIRTFESEIDPFEFRQLDSGHFVLFRKVWLNGQRYTQGLLIEQNTFLSGAAFQEFTQTNLSAMSDLLVAYQGNVLAAFSGTQEQSSRYSSRQIIDKQRTQRGEQLYQIRLSDPFSDLQLIYSITQLPIGSGGQLILWLALVLAAVLLGGFYLMYRLGLSQIELANQQQDFVSAVSHELKTPLTSIRMYGEMLREGWATEEKKKTYYQFIFDESERLTRLINNVLQLARMTRNEQKAELANRNVLELVQEIKPKITSQIESAGFKLEINTEGSLNEKHIMVDSDWLVQIMINLVDNALKFSAKTPQKTIILDVQSHSDQRIIFTISDFGPGIDKQQMKKIFQLFYRSENELTRDTVGTGIGLSLVHQMTVNMGGKVNVENRKLGGEFPGAAFSVVFRNQPIQA